MTNEERKELINIIRARNTAAFNVLVAAGVVNADCFDDELVLFALNFEAFELIRAADAAGLRFWMVAFDFLWRSDLIDHLPIARHVMRKNAVALRESLCLLEGDYGERVGGLLRSCAEYALTAAKILGDHESVEILVGHGLDAGIDRRAPQPKLSRRGRVRERRGPPAKADDRFKRAVTK